MFDNFDMYPQVEDYMEDWYEFEETEEEFLSSIEIS